ENGSSTILQEVKIGNEECKSLSNAITTDANMVKDELSNQLQEMDKNRTETDNVLLQYILSIENGSSAILQEVKIGSEECKSISNATTTYANMVKDEISNQLQEMDKNRTETDNVLLQYILSIENGSSTILQEVEIGNEECKSLSSAITTDANMVKDEISNQLK
ncbi:unnamed protein product, partial [Meganyctiphanes norvegica]